MRRMQDLPRSAAMKLAGIDSTTPDVPGGVIVRDASGNPTGVFRYAAMPTDLQSHSTDDGINSGSVPLVLQ